MALNLGYFALTTQGEHVLLLFVCFVQRCQNRCHDGQSTTGITEDHRIVVSVGF